MIREIENNFELLALDFISILTLVNHASLVAQNILNLTEICVIDKRSHVLAFVHLLAKEISVVCDEPDTGEFDKFDGHMQRKWEG
ncbi:unnamed protein product [Dibothriocephalus latus]|uniref:Uncharacterized protein n=1 Tax=Dibothriocephalus latus TaxID=60516 RepID=A0A3P7KXF0_DIBLA|nr:unnamed protein product [Dibothriocephalus latus]